jgi:hypothetical protein
MLRQLISQQMLTRPRWADKEGSVCGIQIYIEGTVGGRLGRASSYLCDGQTERKHSQTPFYTACPSYHIASSPETLNRRNYARLV